MQYTEGYLLDRRYSLERYVGGGSFGEVWVAHDDETDIQVAVKIYISMDEKGLEEFKKEFQLSFDLNHTNLLHANYMGVNPEDRRPFLVMPFCPEGSVSRNAGNMGEDDIWRFIRDVSAGLAYLHSQDPPIIHQDIKPDNILILKNGDYVITDFGISKQLRQSLRKSGMSLNSAGAISYMGPERFSKNSQAVKASDVWSLGVSIYELATGDLPFCGMGGSMQKQGADIPDLPDEFSMRLNMVFASCLAKETWDRPTAAQLTKFASAVLAGADPEVTWHRNTSITENSVALGQSVSQENVNDAVDASGTPLNEGTIAKANVNTAGVESLPGSDESGFISSEPKVSKKASPLLVMAVVIIGLIIGFTIGLFVL